MPAIARRLQISLCTCDVLQARRVKSSFLFGHLLFNITNVFCAKKGWGMLVYGPGWSLASQFRSYTPPPKKLVFPRPKNENSPLKTAVSDPKFWRFLFVRRKFCRAVLDSREDQWPPPD